jgi:hypothetical protein
MNSSIFKDSKDREIVIDEGFGCIEASFLGKKIGSLELLDPDDIRPGDNNPYRVYQIHVDDGFQRCGIGAALTILARCRARGSPQHSRA